MTNTRPIKINYAVFCDDIRREDNGKLIFIGVYGANILFKSFPASLNLSLAVMGETKEIGPIPCEFKILVGGKETGRIGKISITFDQLGKSIFVIKPIPVNTSAPELLKIEMKQFEREWETVAEIPMQVGS
jgi:hypothetical protein